MIAFIVIGKNEERNLPQCFKSIQNTIEQNKIPRYEIIYVDSASTDNSIAIAQRWGNIKIIALEGKCNAAIGRNTGAANTKADVLYFIDGDMELNPDFIPHVFTFDFQLKYPFISGQLDYLYYNSQGKFLKKAPYHTCVLNGDKYQSTTGGLFIIARELWEKNKGMDIRLRTGEDLDIGLRLRQQKTLLLRKQQTMAVHHTQDYKDHQRLWADLWKGNTLYSRGLLYRKHLLRANLHILPRILKSDPTTPLLFIAFLSTFTFYSTYVILTYFTALIVALLFFQKYDRWYQFFERIPYYVLRDFLNLYAFFLLSQQKNKIL